MSVENESGSAQQSSPNPTPPPTIKLAEAEAELKQAINDVLAWQMRWVRWFAISRWFLKAVKIIAAMGTGVTALITAITGSEAAAISTAITGILTALLVTTESEFRLDDKRKHHTTYWLKFEKLRSDLEMEKELSYEQLQKFRQKYHLLRMRERKDNFAIEEEMDTE